MILVRILVHNMNVAINYLSNFINLILHLNLQIVFLGHLQLKVLSQSHNNCPSQIPDQIMVHYLPTYFEV